MKKLTTTALLLSSSLMCPSLTMADTGFQTTPYVGADLGYLSYEENGYDDANILSIGGKLGVELHKYFSVEARLGTGITEEEDYEGVQGLDLSLDYYLGAYALATLPIGEKLSIYGLLGYTKAEMSAEYAGFEISEDESDMSYGLGAEFKVNDKASFTAEYTNLLDGSTYEVTSINVGMKFNF